jgi:hypothetical protein
VGKTKTINAATLTTEADLRRLLGAAATGDVFICPGANWDDLLPTRRGSVVNKGNKLVVGPTEGKIITCNGKWDDYDCFWPFLVTRRGDEFFLQKSQADGELVYTGSHERFRAYPFGGQGGVIIQLGGKLIVNGEPLPFAYKGGPWAPLFQGIAVQQDGGIAIVTCKPPDQLGV